MKQSVIAQIVQQLAPGGIETMVLDLQQLSDNPERVHIISLEGTTDSLKENWPRLHNITRLHALNKPPGIQWSTVRQLTDLLRTLKVNVVHTHHVGPMLYGGLAAKIAGCGHVHTEHDAWHLSNLKRRALAGTFFHLLRPIVIADAQLVSQSIQRYIPMFSTEVIMNGISVERFCLGDQSLARQHLGLPLNVPFIGCAARLTAVKSHDVLLSAFSRLSADTHLALAGSGELESTLRKQAESLNVSDRVHFLGVVEDMPSFFQAIDVFCLASQREGLPLSPLEAQACGRNVVLTDVGGCSEAVAPDYGLLVPAGDIDSLSTALQRQLDEGCSDQARHSARQFVQKHGDLNRMISQYQQFYLQSLGKQGLAPEGYDV
ncbi:glycosyltransferase [Endozoicomonas montiporae]|uniref:Group 1 glycosyl transferase n=1 Tax=Endozoicomonas montiporae CL-33 TaxID=570277 RepID=A0A142BGE1_9GAMM|nr:glycosyltransferase [Endozoicomonas montiporae]AMO57817.1 group 1 glycosyl transferase [Endozoicomonas montiporae CL-33]